MGQPGGSVLIWIVSLLLGILVVNGRAAGNQISTHLREANSLMLVTEGSRVGLTGDAVSVFDFPVGNENQFPVVHGLITEGNSCLQVFDGFIPRIDKFERETILRRQEPLLPVGLRFVDRRDLQFSVRLPEEFYLNLAAMRNVGRTLTIVKNFCEKRRLSLPFSIGYRLDLNHNPWPLGVNQGLGIQQGGIGGIFLVRKAIFHSLGRTSRFPRLPANENGCNDSDEYKHPFGGCIPLWRLWCGGLCWLATLAVFYYYRDRRSISGGLLCNVLLMGGGTLIWATGKVPCAGGHYCSKHQQSFHSRQSVSQKDLTQLYFCNTVSLMANVLSAEKQTAIIAALAEGSSIRSIERITGVHRDTIMRLGVRVGKGCEMLMDSKMQDLGCNYLQLDEVWGFIGKKERHCSVDDNPELGDVWTFCAIDSETKLVPSFKCGKRTHETANAFVQDIANRVRNRVQISTDALGAYGEAVERAFGADVDYGQIVKVYTHDAAQHPERKYSAPHFASAYRRPIAGNPEMEFVSTSHVERLNATTRLHVKRLSRLTLAFSKKFENFQAAVGLHFAYYNFVLRHNSLRCTPAMAAGIERDFWSVGDLVEATT